MFKTINIKKIIYAIAAATAAASCAGACIICFANDKKPENKTIHEGIPVPVIMYHGITLDSDKCGEFVVTLNQIEDDIHYLKENNFTPVFVNDLIRYAIHDGELPDKPVILTFDDGGYSNYEYLFGLLKDENYKVSLSVVGSFTADASESGDAPNAAYSYLRWCDINEMRESGYYEFCDHSYNMHSLTDRKGVLRLSGETDDEYRHALITDIDGMQKLCEENCGFRPNVFTYPYGFASKEAESMVKELGFEASLGVEEKINYIVKGDSECLYGLGRFNRSGLTDTDSFMKNMLSDYENS